MLTLNGLESEAPLLAPGLVMEIRTDLDQRWQSRWSQVQDDKSSQLTTPVKTQRNPLLHIYVNICMYISACQCHGNS